MQEFVEPASLRADGRVARSGPTAWTDGAPGRARDPTFFAIGAALVETLIAICLILGLVRRPILLAGAVFSFLISAVPESSGRVWQSGQTDIGASIIYGILFLALFVLDMRANAGGSSLHRTLNAQRPAWRRVADFAAGR